MTNPPEWHPDPTGAHEYRWWDGSRWTEHVADGGQASIDPLNSAPAEDTAQAGGQDAGAADAGWTAREGDTSREGSTGWQQPEAQTSETAAQLPADQTWQQADQTWQQADQAGQPSGQPWQQQAPWQQGGGQSPAGWQQAGAPASSSSNGPAIAAMVIGIISLLISWIPVLGLLGGLGGIAALILGFVGRKRSGTDQGGGNGAAITGIVTGILALAVSILVTVAAFSFGSVFFSGYAECLEEGGTEAECSAEVERDLMRRFGE